MFEINNRDYRNKISIVEVKGGFRWCVKTPTGKVVCVSNTVFSTRPNVLQSIRDFIKSSEKGFAVEG